VTNQFKDKGEIMTTTIDMREMAQAVDLPKGVRGARGDDIFNGYVIAQEAWPDLCDDDNSSLTAFAYLWRRFGPPFYGSDPHKDLCRYILTTSDPDVWLIVCPNACSIEYGIGYLKSVALQEEHAKPFREWEEKFESWWLEQHPEITLTDETPKDEVERISGLFWKDRLDGSITKKAVESIGEYPGRQIDPDNWRTCGGVCQRVNQAIYDALRELLRPVYIRDCAINLFGRCDDGVDAAEPSRYAGLGCPREQLDELLRKESKAKSD
jgi:hypothetical protein